MDNEFLEKLAISVSSKKILHWANVAEHEFWGRDNSGLNDLQTVFIIIISFKFSENMNQVHV